MNYRKYFKRGYWRGRGYRRYSNSYPRRYSRRSGGTDFNYGAYRSRKRRQKLATYGVIALALLALVALFKPAWFAKVKSMFGLKTA